MELRIICFEDSSRDQQRLETVFAKHNAQILFFGDPPNDWTISQRQAEQISAFDPHLAIVDLRDDKSRAEAGLRVIRKLREHQLTSGIPIIVWSVWLDDSPRGQRFIGLVREGGATPLLKSKKRLPRASKFLSAANIDMNP